MRNAKEGDLYGVVRIYGKTFEIYYGYYEDYERQSKYNDPVPIYPDLVKTPQYGDGGRPIVTEMQVACAHYRGSETDDRCGRCRHFQKGERLFGLCQCEQMRRNE